jgi:hypothetical protein
LAGTIHSVTIELRKTMIAAVDEVVHEIQAALWRKISSD